MKIISSGANKLEIYKANNYSIIINKDTNNNKGRAGKEELEQEEKEENTQRARKTTLTNARNNIIRLLKSNEDMTTFITLTFSEEVDYKQSKKYLQAMFLKLNRHNYNFKYLWVLEFGSLKGRLHYHLLCNLELPADINFATTNKKKSNDHKDFENNFSKKYWKKGFVDIRNLRQEDNTNIALYISCYITKDLLDKQLEGYRVYGYSNKTLLKPVIYTDYTDKSIKEIINDFKDDFDITYNSSYEIGYTKDGEDRKGIMTYADLKRK